MDKVVIHCDLKYIIVKNIMFYIHIMSDYMNLNLNFHVHYLHKSRGSKMPYSSHNSFSTYVLSRAHVHTCISK